MRKIFEVCLATDRLIKVYWSASVQEYCCRLYVDGTLYAAADYFTTDKQDALDTAFAMAKPLTKG